jgi:hypothetical protein
MICCDELERAMDLEMTFRGEKYEIRDGRILNEIESEYFLRAEQESSGRYNYLAINYCPFCGRPLARGLWLAEKEK